LLKVFAIEKWCAKERGISASMETQTINSATSFCNAAQAQLHEYNNTTREQCCQELVFVEQGHSVLREKGCYESESARNLGKRIKELARILGIDNRQTV